MMRVPLLVFVGLVAALPVSAQELPLFQAKFVIHAPIPHEEGWFPAGWIVTNVRDQATDNVNFMAGVGRKQRNGWLELMAQRQYSLNTNQWFIDFRYLRRFNRLTVFVEATPFLGKMSFYDFARIEYRINRFNIFVESENIHRPGHDLLGIGPGIGLVPLKIRGRIRFAPAVAWQLRPNDPDFIRFYFAFPL